ncbi:endonuclease III [Acidobacteria bacterium AB60]|nr:endonuclease III [Acidobacteria bacterium AB60]
MPTLKKSAPNTAKKPAAAKKSKPAGNAKLAERPRPASRKSDAPQRGDLAPERIAAILKALDEAYPNAVCALTHTSPWELLVATILSAQCTDARVNMVTPVLFKRFPSPAAMMQASLPELEEIIRTTGFFRNKAKSIKGAAQAIVERFGGKVPETLEELITVPGAARKTANVVLGVSFGKAEGVVVDTHVFRIAHRLSLVKGDTAPAVEQELMKILPYEKWIDFSHQIIHHGRQVCLARSPRCKDCNLETICHSKDKTWQS